MTLPWFDDVARCVASASSPARASQVLLLMAPRDTQTVIVPDDQLSFGYWCKEGQNVSCCSSDRSSHWTSRTSPLLQAFLTTFLRLLKRLLTRKRLLIVKKYVSPNGTPGRNMARPGSDFCGIHAMTWRMQRFLPIQTSLI